MGVKKVITETVVREQIRRLRGYPRWEDFREELVKTLWRHAHSNEHAERILNEILETRKPDEKGFVSCPTVAELIDCCKCVPIDPPGAQMQPASKMCERCGGTGFVHTQRKVRAIPAMVARMYDYSAQCPCRKGVVA
jgi:hypothetical protein